MTGLPWPVRDILFMLALEVTCTLAFNPELTRIPDWGYNPTNLILNVYVPTPLPVKPPVILALHACSFDGPFYNQENNYTAYADDRGFITLFPSSLNHDKCWDVSSEESLTHDGNGDSTGLANMVKWAIAEYNADPTRIYVTGSSSGCMMTNVMCGTYPDVFAAASCYSGVPAGCLAGSGSSPGSGDPSCAIGNLTKTGAEWAEQVRGMHKSYEGPYPKMMIWHGTGDEMISYNNLAETLKQWSTILDVAWRENVTETPPLLNYTQMVYGDGSKLLGWSAVGVGHTVPCDVARDLDWFGIQGSSETGTPHGSQYRLR